jgi:class 3 adenylate cyclase
MPVNIAARLQQLASPGEILISQSTVDSILRGEKNGEDTFGEMGIVPLPQTRIKGLQEPVPVFRISESDHQN